MVSVSWPRWIHPSVDWWYHWQSFQESWFFSPLQKVWWESCADIHNQSHSQGWKKKEIKNPDTAIQAVLRWNTDVNTLKPAWGRFKQVQNTTFTHHLLESCLVVSSSNERKPWFTFRYTQIHVVYSWALTNVSNTFPQNIYLLPYDQCNTVKVFGPLIVKKLYNSTRHQSRKPLIWYIKLFSKRISHTSAVSHHYHYFEVVFTS